jgi:DNA polymerase elongation subunit (family B)
MRPNVENILFLDIETVPQYECFNDAPENTQNFWAKKIKNSLKQDETAEQVYNRAGIWAEFGKIICISAGFIHKKDDKNVFRVKSFYGDDEKDILIDFIENLKKFVSRNKKETLLCAHNGKEFDFPYLARRILINKIDLPKLFDVGGKKPWEVPFLDTMELWRFGDYKNYTSLDLIANVFDIPSPKGDIDGSDIADVYYIQKDLERIAMYCEKDVLTLARVYLRLKEHYEIEFDLIND